MPSAFRTTPRSGTLLSTINSQPSTRNDQAPRVLIIQLKRIGDAILTTPVLAALRAGFPGVHLTLALDRATAALAPALDADRTLIRGQNLWLPLLTSRFDVALDLTGNDRSALVTALSRAPRRLTWQRFARKPLRHVVYTEFVDSSVRDRHTVDHHLDLLRPLGLTVEGLAPSLHLPPAALTEADAALAEAGVSGPFVVVHPGTARAEKYWLPERWAEVIGHLERERGLPVVLTGSNDPAERAHLAAITAQLSTVNPQPRLAILAGKLSLLGTAAVLASAQFVAAVDSAPVHFADALGVPVVALFGPTNPFHWRPRRTTSRLVTASADPDLRPAYPQAPMSDIPVAAVLAALPA